VIDPIKNNWLIISYYASTGGQASSHTIDSRLGYFRKRGINFHLLSSICGPAYRDVPHIRVPSLFPGGIKNELRNILSRKTTKSFWFNFWKVLLLIPVYPFFLLEEMLVIPFTGETTWSWFLTATPAAIFICLRNKPKVMYSTGGSFSAHITAAITSRLFNIPFIAELQDPLVHEGRPPGIRRALLARIERFLFKRASRVVFVTKQACIHAAERNVEGSKATAIYLGAETVPLFKAEEKRRDRFIIGHFGSLSRERNLDTFLDALSRIFRESPEKANKITLRIYGKLGDTVRARLDSFSFQDVIEIKGMIPRDEVNRAMSDVDQLLLVQHASPISLETIPLKTFEYLNTRKPVLALLNSPELRELLDGLGHKCVDVGDTDGIRNALEDCLSLWEQDRLREGPLPSPYTVDRAVDELIALANGVLSA